MFRSVTIEAFRIFDNKKKIDKNQIDCFFSSNQYLQFSTAKLSFKKTFLVFTEITIHTVFTQFLHKIKYLDFHCRKLSYALCSILYIAKTACRERKLHIDWTTMSSYIYFSQIK